MQAHDPAFEHMTPVMGENGLPIGCITETPTDDGTRLYDAWDVYPFPSLGNVAAHGVGRSEAVAAVIEAHRVETEVSA